MTVSKACDLCGFPTGRLPFTYTASGGKNYTFCCMGCRQVFIMLLEMADGPDPADFRETDLFRKCLEMGIVPRTEEEAIASRRKGFRFSSRLENASEHPDDENVLSLQVKIADMWCPACAWYIETVISKMPGLKAVKCHFSTDRLSLWYDPVKSSPAEIILSIGRLGYGAAIPGEDLRQKENHREFIRLILSILLTMNVMMLSFSLYSGFFIELSEDASEKISWPIFIMATIVVFYGGWPVIKRAYTGLKSFSFGMETLVCAGAFSAYCCSVYHLSVNSIHLYFDTASMLMALVLLGKTLERKAKDRITETLDLFSSVIPKKARIFNDRYPLGKYVPAEKLQTGDVFGVTTGEILPADGILLDGSGLVDESLLTGEAKNRKKGPGDRLMSGSAVVDGRFKIKADAVGKDAVLGQMAGIMASAMEQKTAMEAPIEKLLQWFVPLVILLAIGTGVYCSWSGLSPESSIMRAITVLVISCPCALGIAIPMARVAGVSVTGKKGILVRNFSSFELVPEIDTIVFDKTGTITKGDWELLDVLCFGKMTRDRALLLAAVLEEEADHAAAWVIKDNAGAIDNTDVGVIEDIRHHEQGMSGTMNGKEIHLGSRKFVDTHLAGSELPAFNHSISDERLSSQVFMGVDNTICAVFLFGDSLKDGIGTWIEKYKEMGLNLSLISGDDDGITRKIADELGISVSHGGKTPLEKAEFIARLQEKGQKVAMVGDGINDAPAMAQADLAVGIHGNNPLAKETADVTLMKGDPGQLLDFFPLARQVGKKIRQNFRFSFLYNIISIPIAMAGLLTPIVAVSAMLASSLTVIGNTLIMLRK